MQAKYQIAAIVREIREAQGVVAFNGKRTVYTLADKQRIVNIYKAGTDTVAGIVYHLKKEKLGAGWEMMLRNWVAQDAQGQFALTSAIAVTPRKVEDVTSAGTRLEAILLEMLNKGITEETLHSVVSAVAEKHGKSKAVLELKSLLAARGLTVEDLK